MTFASGAAAPPVAAQDFTATPSISAVSRLAQAPDLEPGSSASIQSGQREQSSGKALPTEPGSTEGAAATAAFAGAAESALDSAGEGLAEAEPKLEPGRLRVRAGHISKLGSVITVEGEDGRPVIIEIGELEAGGVRIQARRVVADLGARTLRASGEVRLERARLITRRPYAFDRSVRRDGTGRIVIPGSPGGPSLTPRTSPAFSGHISSGEGSVGRTERGPGHEEYFTEVLVGRELAYDNQARSGSLDGAMLQLGTFDISAASIVLEGDTYQARDVTLRPSGLSEREKKIYGTPPFSLRARQAGVRFEDGQDGQRGGRLWIRQAGLYYRNTRLLPIPRALLAPLSRVRIGGPVGIGLPSNGPPLLRIVPTFSLNSTDRILLGARISAGLRGPHPSNLAGAAVEPGTPNSKNSGAGALLDASSASLGAGSGRAGRARAAALGGSTSVVNLDLGISGRLGFRGGISLENRSRLGLLSLQARRADLISTQLTNKLEVDRSPELSFDSALLPVLSLGAGRGVGAFASASGGRFSERAVRSGLPRVESSRLSGTVGLSTRLDDRDGLYADIFATRTRYGLSDSSYSNTGFELGYLGQVLPQVRGLFLLRRVSLDGSTPFRFDVVEIPRELRATFDIEATPRFLIPIDLRYDLGRKTLRDRSVGVLRNYKTFAYGVVYQSARRDLRLELRSSF